MDDDVKEAYIRAGEIGRDVREGSRRLVEEGVRIEEIADSIEKRIRDLGGEVAFPTNVCINDVAAHYAPKFRDETVVGKDDVVTIDLGVHIDGYISDSAHTIDLSGRYKDLLKVNKEALEKAIELVKPGVSVAEVGRLVQKTITDAGFKPIENLTGHEVKQYNLHAGISVPNVDISYEREIKEGMVLAIEPFATNGYGRVIESSHAEIFSLKEYKPVRMRESRILLKEIEGRRELPFTKRWYINKINPLRLDLVLRELLSVGAVERYPVLHEKEKGIVSQFEHTMIITGDGCEVTTA